MDDATLVHRAATGDREAWAVIYDRYADSLHDYCWSILRDHHEAEDALHDSFMAAAAKLPQLREPSRLRPWLYSICRTQALARTRTRSRLVPTEGTDDMTPPSADQPVAEQHELARLIQDAAGGLAPRDRAVLDLHLRHGFEGAELGEALGVNAHHATVLLSRVRDQVERSLGALLVARMGRKDCPELDRLLAGWDGRLSPLLRKRVARHVEECEVCGERKRTAVSPMALLSAAPVVAAPASLRDRVLDDVTRISAGGPGIGSTSGARRRPSRTQLLAAAAAAALLATGVAVVAASGDGEDPAEVAAVATTTTSFSQPTTTTAGTLESTSSLPGTSPAVTGPSPTTTATTKPSSSTTTLPVTTTTTTTTAPAVVPPQLVVETPLLAYGARGTTAELHLTNGGGGGLDWSIATGHTALTASPAGGSLAPGGAATITVTLNRAAAPEGEFTQSVAITARSAGDGRSLPGGATTASATVEHVPVITGLATDRPRLVFGSASPCSTTRATAQVADESSVGVVLSWRQGSGTVTESPMASGGAGGYSATIGPVLTPSGGNITWWVTATDSRGNRTQSPNQTLPVGTTC